MRREFASGLALLLAVMAPMGNSAGAFDEQNCERLLSVQVKDVQEPYGLASGYASAREHALQRAYEQAAAQATGLWVESKSQSEVKLEQDLAYQSFSQLDKSELSGFIRPVDIKETRTVIGGQEAVSLTVDAVVCVPKPEFLTKWRQEKAEREREPPHPIDPHTAQWFDAKTGQPLLWYRRDKNQQYFFFDNKGFDPANGEPLFPVSAKVREDWQQDDVRRTQAAREREEQERRERETKAAQDAVRQQQEAAHAELLAHSSKSCDQLAGNPYDRNRGSEDGSASFDLLKEHTAEAIQACDAAAQKFPSEQRYRYQLARAYQAADVNKAYPLLKELTAHRYPAAFDNLGWALLDGRLGRNDLPGAIAAFRMGAALGDPSSMYSLANFIIDDKVPSSTLNDALQLLRSAAQLGHLPSQARIEEVEEKIAQATKEEAEQERAREMFMNVMGGFLRAMPRN